MLAKKKLALFLTHPVCLIGFRWGSIGEGSTVGPTLVDPRPRPRAPKAREARGHGSTSVGPTVDHSRMDPHLNPIKHTWAVESVQPGKIQTRTALISCHFFCASAIMSHPWLNMLTLWHMTTSPGHTKISIFIRDGQLNSIAPWIEHGGDKLDWKLWHSK